MKQDISYLIYEIKQLFIAELKNSGIKKSIKEAIEYDYYVSYLLNNCKNTMSFYESFPTHSYVLLEERIDRPSQKININKQLLQQAEEKYPNGASLLKECMLLKLIE